MRDPYESKLIRLVAILVMVVPITLLIGFVIFARVAVVLAGGSLRPLVPFAIGWLVIAAVVVAMWARSRKSE